jgi:hypothetical protein
MMERGAHHATGSAPCRQGERDGKSSCDVARSPIVGVVEGWDRWITTCGPNGDAASITNFQSVWSISLSMFPRSFSHISWHFSLCDLGASEAGGVVSAGSLRRLARNLSVASFNADRSWLVDYRP